MNGISFMEEGDTYLAKGFTLKIPPPAVRKQAQNGFKEGDVLFKTVPRLWDVINSCRLPYPANNFETHETICFT